MCPRSVLNSAASRSLLLRTGISQFLQCLAVPQPQDWAEWEAEQFPLLKHPQVRRWLVPFILACFLYFLLWIPVDQPSWVSALIKCQPILCLVVFLWAVAPGGSYTWLLQGALVCSAVGDACLIWPEAFFYGEQGIP